MRIAMIGHKRIPSGEGGIERVVAELSARLAQRGHQVDVYNRSGHHIFGEEYDREFGYDSTSDLEAEHTWHGATIHTVKAPQGRAQVPVYSWRAVRRAVRDGADVIILHASGSCIRAGLARRLGVPCVCMLHGIDSRRIKWGRFASWYLKRGEKAAMTRSDACIVLSQHMKEELEKQYGGEALIASNGVTLPSATAAATVIGERDPLLDQYGLEKDGYLLWTGRIVPEKGLQLLIEAFKACKSDKKLVIAGGTETRYPEHADEIRRQAADDPRIVFTGYIEPEQIGELYRGAYACVFPSLLEGMSLSLLEALSYGTCCLVSDLAENTEVTANHALTFKTGDADDLRQKLQELLDHPETAVRYSEGEAAYVAKRFSWDKSADRILEICEEVVGRNS